MAITEEYKAFVAELFESLGPIRIRSMFGGAGVYAGDLFFALIADERIYLKVDDENRPEFEAEGLEPFTYETAKGVHGVMSYYEMPDAAYDDGEEAAGWARKALDAALRAARKKPKKKKPAKKAGKKRSAAIALNTEKSGATAAAAIKTPTAKRIAKSKKSVSRQPTTKSQKRKRAK